MPQYNEPAFAGLAESVIIREWIQAFHQATGMAIMLLPLRPSDQDKLLGSHGAAAAAKGIREAPHHVVTLSETKGLSPISAKMLRPPRQTQHDTPLMSAVSLGMTPFGAGRRTPGSMENPFCLLVRLSPKGRAIQSQLLFDLGKRVAVQRVTVHGNITPFSVIARSPPRRTTKQSQPYDRPPEHIPRCAAVRARCFAQMQHWLIPLFVNRAHVANLYAGQVFTQLPTNRRFEAVARTLVRFGLESKLRLLRKAWFETPVIPPAQFMALGDLLTLFARLVAEPSNRWLLDAHKGEPQIVREAKHFVLARLHQTIFRADVAGHVGCCPQHLSELFKKITGMGLMHYVQRARIEKAKAALADPSVAIKQVAFMAGFASVAHFDRVFRRHTGVTPTRYSRQSINTNDEKCN